MAGGVEGTPSASIDSSLSSEGLKELPTLNKRDLYLFFYENSDTVESDELDKQSIIIDGDSTNVYFQTIDHKDE